jgi:hypothetical protein
MTVQSANLKAMSLKRLPKPGVETAVALIGTAFSALLLLLAAMNAGPLWRDETNTFNLALMPSLGDIWNNLPFESFPPLWPLLLRGCSLLGLTGSDAGIRLLGLCVAWFFLVSLWLCSRWIGARAPTLSVALLGSLPAFILIMGANRAYGLAGCLVVLSFGMLWRTVALPSKSWVLWTGLVCLLFVQCLYYDSIFLCAMLAGGAVVALRRQQWKTLWALAGIGAVCGASLAIYLPIIHRGSAYLPLIRSPFFDSAAVWNGLCDALAARSSANPNGADGPQIWFWIELLLLGFVVAVAMQRKRGVSTQNREAAGTRDAAIRSDLALFAAISMVLGIAGYFVFMLRLQFFITTWYYVVVLILCAISLDAILGANWPALRPWGLLRVGFMLGLMTLSAKPAWAEAHTRRSNVDVAAAFLSHKASADDLIVVQEAWQGITFNRYYHGQTRWMTIPPIDSHRVHRNDLVMEKLSQPDTMVPVLRAITDTLRSGNSVWVVGSIPIVRPKKLPPEPTPPPPLPPKLPTKWWLGSYVYWWNLQAATLLFQHALHEQAQPIPVPGPVNALEDVSVRRFSGYK